MSPYVPYSAGGRPDDRLLRHARRAAARARHLRVAHREHGDDLAAYVAESGTDPEEEFGPVADFAEQLTGTGAPATDGGAPALTPDPEVETWRWRADAFHEQERLAEFGEQGWEVERIDAQGRFVSRRDLTRPQRWEYRRETVVLGSHRTPAERLAPDGWESCGSWSVFEYFKRPKSASLGPAGELDEAPDGPGRRMFWSRRFYAFIAAYAVTLAAFVIGGALLLGGGEVAGALLAGALVGGAAAAAWVVIGRRRARTRRP